MQLSLVCVLFILPSLLHSSILFNCFYTILCLGTTQTQINQGTTARTHEDSNATTELSRAHNIICLNAIEAIGQFVTLY